MYIYMYIYINPFNEITKQNDKTLLNQKSNYLSKINKILYICFIFRYLESHVIE